MIHSAATVSFDSPLDAAVEINLLGPVRIAAALNRLHPAGALPHLIAVSTAYVAGLPAGSGARGHPPGHPLVDRGGLAAGGRGRPAGPG